jgi:TRAP transporter 4TM/12TM fusion protein
VRELTGGLRACVALWLAFWAAAHLYFAGGPFFEWAAALVDPAIERAMPFGGFGFPEPVEMRSLHLLVFTPPLFLLYPAFATRSPRARPSLFDWGWAAASAAPHLWVFANAGAVSDRMEYVDPFSTTMMALGITCLVTMLEAIRRAVEPGLAWMVAGCLLYMFTGHYWPGVLNTRVFTTPEIIEAAWLVPTAGGVYGPLTGIVATTIAVFILFGAFMQGSGTGRLFSNLGAAVAGRYTGGPAKVSVVTSGLFGTMSGSSVSNVITTGAMTIPLMVKVGYRPAVAGGIESAASVGGALMPPVMGAAAFIMANFLNVPYAEVMVAAMLPSVLYYGALFLQTDLYAVRNGLRGVARSEVPPLLPTLMSGWYYIAAIVGLTVLLLAFRIEAEAPFWVCLFLLGIAVLRARTTGFNLRRFCGLVVDAGQAVAQLVALIAGIGLIIGALSMTGVANSFSRELVQYAAGNIALLLFFGAITSFILGMGMTASACYIFLAIVLAPALVQAGLDPMASHLYVLYWGIVSFITPPVALAAIAAASIAKSSPMLTGLMALRIGFLLMLLPVLFVLQPALILRGDLPTILQAVLTASVAVVLIASALEGYVYKVGTTPIWARVPILAGGLLMLIPEGTTDLIGLAIGLGGIAALRLSRPPAPA